MHTERTSIARNIKRTDVISTTKPPAKGQVSEEQYNDEKIWISFRSQGLDRGLIIMAVLVPQMIYKEFFCRFWPGNRNPDMRMFLRISSRVTYASPACPELREGLILCISCCENRLVLEEGRHFPDWKWLGKDFSDLLPASGGILKDPQGRCENRRPSHECCNEDGIEDLVPCHPGFHRGRDMDFQAGL